MLQQHLGWVTGGIREAFLEETASELSDQSLLNCSTLLGIGSPVPNWVKCSPVERQSFTVRIKKRTSSGEASGSKHLWNL